MAKGKHAVGRVLVEDSRGVVESVPAAAAESDGTLFGSVERLVDVAQFNADREWDHLALLALIDAVRTLAAAVKKGED